MVRRLLGVLPGFAAAAVAVTTSTASAQTFSPIGPGVQYAKYSTNQSWVHVAKVDLCAPGLRMRATSPTDGQQTVSSFGQSVGGTVAINGDWPSRDGTNPSLPAHFPRGLAVGNGAHFPGTVDTVNYGVLAFGLDRAELSAMEVDVGGQALWMTEVVSGQPTLVLDGNLRDNTGGHCASRNPRTATGLDAAGTTLLLVVADGRSSVSAGLTCNQLASVMKDLGAHVAMNQDGGGSSTMWTKGGGVVNDPSDGSQRSLVNHWSVITAGEGPPQNCVTRPWLTPTESVKRHVTLAAFGAWGFRLEETSLISDAKLAEYPDGAPFDAGPTVLRATNGKVVIDDHGAQRHVPNPYALSAWRLASKPTAMDADAAIAALGPGPALTTTPLLVKGPGDAVFLIDRPPTSGGAGGSGGTTSGGAGGMNSAGASGGGTSTGGTGTSGSMGGGAGGGAAGSGAGSSAAGSNGLDQQQRTLENDGCGVGREGIGTRPRLGWLADWFSSRR